MVLTVLCIVRKHAVITDVINAFPTFTTRLLIQASPDHRTDSNTISNIQLIDFISFLNDGSDNLVSWRSSIENDVIWETYRG